MNTPLMGGPTFTLRHRIYRLIWSISWSLLASWTPVPFFGLRRWLLKIFGADIHSSARVYPGVKIWYPPNLSMGEHSCLGPDVICYCMAPITLQPFSLVSQRAHLCAGTHDIDSPAFDLRVKPILIRDHAWVAAEAFVGPGVTVGSYAVLGARSVCARDLEDSGVYVGNPARKIRQRKH